MLFLLLNCLHCFEFLEPSQIGITQYSLNVSSCDLQRKNSKGCLVKLFRICEIWIAYSFINKITKVKLLSRIEQNSIVT